MNAQMQNEREAGDKKTEMNERRREHVQMAF